METGDDSGFVDQDLVDRGWEARTHGCWPGKTFYWSSTYHPSGNPLVWRKSTVYQEILQWWLLERGYEAAFEYLIPFKDWSRRYPGALIGYDIHVDLAFPNAKLAIEVDGPPHREEKQIQDDLDRDASLRAVGWEVIRVTNEEVNRCSSLTSRGNDIISLIKLRSELACRIV
jgi:Protein of unknown function (DUF559)